MAEEQNKLTKKIENEIIKKLFNDGYRSLLFIVQHYTSKEKAADVIQEAFVILSENANKLDLLRPPVPYLRMVAINLAKKHYLDKQGRVDFALDSLVGYELSDRKVDLVKRLEQKEVVDFLFEVIKSFSEKKRYVANLRIRENLPFDTVSELVGVSLRTAKRYMKKAKEEIKISFDKRYPDRSSDFLDTF